MPILAGWTRRSCAIATGRSCGMTTRICSTASGPSTTSTARSSTATGPSSTTSSPSGSSSCAIPAPMRSWPKATPFRSPGTAPTLAWGRASTRPSRPAFQLRAAGGQPTCVCALAAEIPARHRGRHLSGVILRAMSGLAREAGLSSVIAPVRPSRKDRYPTIPLERYARWTRSDGSPFDPWIRVHTLLGAASARSSPVRCTSPAPSRSGSRGRRCGSPRPATLSSRPGLATVHIDRERDLGEYWEPNVWLIHGPGPAA